jgi:4-aminobutyrate aminotransferase-like enzyme
VRGHLDQLKQKSPFVVDVRGEGLVYGVEIKDDATANRCVLEAYRGIGVQGVHLLGPLAGKVLRVSPPLVASAEDLEGAFGVLEKAWERV